MGERSGKVYGGTLALILALLLLLPGSAAADGDASPLGVSLSAKHGQSSLPAGRPFRFAVAIENPTADAEPLTVELGLRKPGSRKLFWFEQRETVAAPGTTELDAEVTPTQWFDSAGAYRLLARTSAGPKDDLFFDLGEPTVLTPTFENVTGPARVVTKHRIGSICNGTHKAGAAWADVEGDGDLDLYMPDQVPPAKLWINEDGQFSEQAAAAGVDNGGREGYGAVFADYDNDGDPDLFVTNKQADRLYENDSTGHFTDVGPAAGLADTRPGSSGAWADYDADGNLDLYVARWGTCTEDAYLDDSLYRNEGDGTFSDQTALLGAGPIDGRGFLGGWFDYDGDNDVDLYLANDFTQGPSPQPNGLWRNDGDTGGGWSFSDVSGPSGTGFAMNSMGLGFADYDGDLDLDVAVSNIAANRLLQNDGLGGFADRAEQARVDRPIQRFVPEPLGLSELTSITWGLAFADLNNDGWEDLYMAAGSMQPEKTQPNELYVNGGNGRFLDLSAPSAADDPSASRGIAFADYDADGRVDMFVVNRGGTPHLFHNTTDAPGSHWLAVDTVGRASNRDGCGATLLAKLRGGPELLRQVYCGSTGLASGSDPTVHFGLGGHDRIARLEVTWPSGITQVRRNVPIDQSITVREPVA